jgi:hypothetical protein
VAASVQHKRRKVFHQENRATDAEVIASENRKIGLQMDAAFPLPVGQDMGQALLDRMDGLTQAVEGLTQTANDNQTAITNLTQTVIDNQNAIAVLTQTVNERFDRVNERLIPMSIQIAKITNRSLGPNDTIVMVPNLRGEFPPENLFPQTQSQIATEMQANNVEQLLRFYGVDFQRDIRLPEKKSLLYSQLGFVTSAELFRV